jgi:hypothetical protein
MERRLIGAVILLILVGVCSYLIAPPASRTPRPWMLDDRGFYKTATVVRMGSNSRRVILRTERGMVEVRAGMVIGSVWSDVVVDADQRVVRKTLVRALRTACLESVRVRRSGEMVVGHQQVLDRYGNTTGMVELVACNPKRKK